MPYSSTLVLCALYAVLAAPCAALAVDDPAGLDACLAATLALHPGVVVEWEVEDGTGRGYEIEIVTRDGSVWEIDCHPATGLAQAPQRSVGTLDYAALSNRARVAEAQAREMVRNHYPGRFIEMQYDTTWRGGSRYVYTVITPDDREARVEVDAASGRILRSRSESRD